MLIFDLLQLRSRSGRLSRRYRNRCQFISFLENRINACGIQEFRSNNHLKPETGFVGFFLYHTRFMNEIRSGFRSAKSAIIRRDRTSTANNLICYCVSTARPRQNIRQFQDSQCKRFGSFLHLVLVHASFRSTIQNRKSKL